MWLCVLSDYDLGCFMNTKINWFEVFYIALKNENENYSNKFERIEFDFPYTI